MQFLYHYYGYKWVVEPGTKINTKLCVKFTKDQLCIMSVYPYVSCFFAFGAEVLAYGDKKGHPPH